MAFFRPLNPVRTIPNPPPSTVVYLIKGVIIGFALAAAVGPVCLLCLRRSLTDGRFVGFLSGLGVATADTFYVALATFGVSSINAALDHYHDGLRVAAGLILIALGVHTYRAPPPSTEPRPEHAASRPAAYFSTLVLTLANPATFFAITLIFAASRLTPETNTLVGNGLIVLGVFAGSCVWWLLLCLGADWFRRKLSTPMLRLINHVAAYAIIAFGASEIVIIALRHWHHLKP